LLSRFVHDQDSGAIPQMAYARATVTSNRKVDSVDAPAPASTVSFTAPDQDAGYSLLGQEGTVNAVQEMGLARGSGSGQNHQIELTLVGGSQVRLADLYAEIM
jgi:hypothetical protein